MGVPSFFRWLLEKYPRVIHYVKEEFVEYDDNGKRILPDSSSKNPNGVEYDNLYLDMNGIIHPCCHPEGGAQPKSEDEMIQLVFEYIDHIFSMVRPRKLLYLAIDGVAPRAKMNQQRARRFRAAQEREEVISTRKKLESYYHKKGWNVPSAPPPSWDYNVITPGTPFMDKLAKALRYWISCKLHSDAGWKGIKIILSDANIPGEGEHKIAQFIRRCRLCRGYDPNTKHVLYGLDADLFMLGLATHEIHFTILREEVLFGKNKPCNKCGIAGHFEDRCQNEPKPETTKKTLKPFVFANLCILREYLEYELKVDVDWFDFERVIDDFVFLCFFVGNDFLPHLPSLEIREGAIDNLFKYYKQFLPKFGGYLTEPGGKINLERANMLLQKLGDIEDEVFKTRTQSENSRHRRNQQKSKDQKRERILKQKQKQLIKNENNDSNQQQQQQQQAPLNKWDINLAECKLEDEYDENQMEFKKFFTEYDLEIDDHFLEKDFEHQLKAIHRASQNVSKCTNKEVEPDLLFGTSGFKQRYYRKKLHINYDEKPDLLEKLIFEYCRGLAWVMLYYYQGCASWSWFYPFHYAPFASDLNNIQRFEGKFNFNAIKSKPFTPFGQLMGVLPASSGKVALPKQFSKLMSDPSSSIIDFYPTDFKLDLNGKMYNWQAVILLPFVDADRLLNAIKPLEEKLMGDEKRMNGVGNTLVYVNRSHPLSRSILPLYSDKDDEKINSNSVMIQMDQQLSQGINGFIGNDGDAIFCGDPLIPPLSVPSLQAVQEGVDVVSCTYKLPAYEQHKTELLAGCKIPEPVLDVVDFEHMEKAPRFGKPRVYKRKDTHFNYNRGWDANIGYAEGDYKRKHNKHLQHELHYQPTRQEYNEHRSFNKGGGSYGRQSSNKWVPKDKNKSTEHNIHVATSNGIGPYSNKNYNNNNRRYNSRRNMNNNNNNNNYNRYNNQYQQQQQPQPQQPQQQMQYNQQNYYQQQQQQQQQWNTQPLNQQWYPQQTYGGYNNYQQQQYYGGYNPYYQQQQQQPYMQQPNAYYQQAPNMNPYTNYNNPQQSNQPTNNAKSSSHAKKWG